MTRLNGLGARIGRGSTSPLYQPKLSSGLKFPLINIKTGTGFKLKAEVNDEIFTLTKASGETKLKLSRFSRLELTASSITMDYKTGQVDFCVRSCVEMSASGLNLSGKHLPESIPVNLINPVIEKDPAEEASSVFFRSGMMDDTAEEDAADATIEAIELACKRIKPAKWSKLFSWEDLPLNEMRTFTRELDKMLSEGQIIRNKTTRTGLRVADDLLSKLKEVLCWFNA